MILSFFLIASLCFTFISSSSRISLSQSLRVRKGDAERCMFVFYDQEENSQEDINTTRDSRMLSIGKCIDAFKKVTGRFLFKRKLELNLSRKLNFTVNFCNFFCSFIGHPFRYLSKLQRK